MTGDRALASLVSAQRPLVRAFVVSITVLCAVHLASVVMMPVWRGDPASLRYVIGEWLHLGAERGLGTWFSVLQLALAAVIAGLISHRHRQRGEPWRAWALVAVILSCLSLDEQIAIHENFGVLVTRLGVDDAGFGFWFLPALGLVAIVGVSLLSFAVRLPARTRWGLIGAGGLFVAGAVGFEAAAWVVVVVMTRDLDAVYSAPVGLLIMAEEGLEMLAVSIAIAVMLTYASSLLPADAISAETPAKAEYQ